MIYAVKRANLVSELLSKLKDSSSRMVVGQFVNLDYWIDEVKAALKSLDEHNLRFDKMYGAQKEWLDAHGDPGAGNCPICKGICEYDFESIKPVLPKMSKDTRVNKNKAKQDLLNSTYYFLLRCYKLKLMNKKELLKRCEDAGTSVDFSDLEE